MKNILLLSFSFFLVLVSLGISEAKPGETAGFVTKEFTKSNKGSFTLYSAYDPSGCTTTVKVWNSLTTFELWHGKGCDANIDMGNSIDVAADNFQEIVIHFDLQRQMKGMNRLLVDIGVKISHEPLMIYLNTADDWPDNYLEYFNAKAPSADKAFELYREYLRNAILESRLYAPIFNVLKKWGCEARLSTNLYDPLFFYEHKVTKKDLIEWGVFTSGEAMKDLFPSVKGGLELEINCSKNGDGSQ